MWAPGLDALDHATLAERVRAPSGRVYTATQSCLLPGQEPRRTAIKLVEHPSFDTCILLVIIANCATMAWQSPLDPSGTRKEAILDACEWAFLIIFTAEVIVKIAAFGLVVHKASYLRDPWCQLDFTVVSLAWLPILFPSLGNYSVLRALRALRPLRALKRLPDMPMLIEWVLSVLPKMGNVLMLFGFVFLVFGIVGMELFKGTLHYRCALDGLTGTRDHAGEPHGPAALLERLEPQAAVDTGIACNAAAMAGGSAAAGGLEEGSGLCPVGSTCEYFEANPLHGISSFDSIGLVSIAFVQAITFDEWATPMYALMAAVSPYACVYFSLIVMIAGFFVINLFLAGRRSSPYQHAAVARGAPLTPCGSLVSPIRKITPFYPLSLARGLPSHACPCSDARPPTMARAFGSHLSRVWQRPGANQRGRAERTESHSARGKTQQQPIHRRRPHFEESGETREYLQAEGDVRGCVATTVATIDLKRYYPSRQPRSVIARGDGVCRLWQRLSGHEPDEICSSGCSGQPSKHVSSGTALQT